MARSGSTSQPQSQVQGRANGPIAMDVGGRRDAAAAADRGVQISRRHFCKMIPKHALKTSNNTYNFVHILPLSIGD
ncbi:hypothetical protein Y032_0121g1005 [Ancylostoma ceylanicum]|uniref:Uncharacterized protein n=1 Tax=Ancylostoma ceylanicum TaxID=53326 RepID=A0A016TA49_9BILA|nr:hypothetical protein Y032_0121g1005 [Ancylostoma ceylanicum]